MKETRESSRRRKLARLIEVPVDELDAFVKRNRFYLTWREYSAIRNYYSIGRNRIETLRVLGEQLGVTVPTIARDRKNGEKKLRRMALVERAPADPLEQNTDEFFNPRRAKEADVSLNVLWRILGGLNNEFERFDQELNKSVLPNMRRIVQETEDEILSIPGIGKGLLPYLKRLLATAGLELAKHEPPETE